MKARKVCLILSVVFIILGCGLLGYLVKDYSTAKGVSIKGNMVLKEFGISKNQDKKDTQQQTEEGVSDDNLLGMLQSSFQNEDVVGYVLFEEAGISYPVLQGTDNEEYMRKDIYGNVSVCGSIFLDYENASDFSDVSSILYGHHMRNGSMFGSLEKSLSNGWGGKKFYIYSRDKKLTYDIVSAKPVQPDLRGKYLVKDEAGLGDFINELKTGVYKESGNKENFVTLLTCHYVNRSTIRYAVTGCLSAEEEY